VAEAMFTMLSGFRISRFRTVRDSIRHHHSLPAPTPQLPVPGDHLWIAASRISPKAQ
jgi:hypothetical protein